MNNTFNLRRFGLLLKRQWLEFGKIYLITLLVTLGIIIAFYAVPLANKAEFRPDRLDFRLPLFIVLGFLFVSIVASNYFAHLGQKARAAIDLMIPASTFEKFLSGILFASVLSVASYILLFYLVDLVFVNKVLSFYSGTTTSSYSVGVNGKMTNVTTVTDNVQYFFTKYNPNDFKAVYWAPFLMTSIFLLGSVYFNRFHYIKTAISVMIFSGIWTYIMVKVTEGLMNNKMPIHHNNSGNNKDMAEFWMIILLTVLTLIFWSITYVRLKEKEV